QGFFVAALNEDLVAVAKHQRSKSIPLRLENPISGGRQFAHSLGEHRQNRRIHWKLHAPRVNQFVLFVGPMNAYYGGNSSGFCAAGNGCCDSVGRKRVWPRDPEGGPVTAGT